MNHFVSEDQQAVTMASEYFERLSIFLNRQHRHPNRYDDPILWDWIQTLRKKYDRRLLDAATIRQLEAIGFKWTIKEAKWFDNAKQVKWLLTEHQVQPSFNQHTKLFYWLKDAIDRLRNKALPGDERKIVEEIVALSCAIPKLPRQTKSRDKRWEVNLTALLEFRGKHHMRWPRQDADDEVERRLATWCRDLRVRYRKKALENEWINKLREIGFNFKSRHPQIGISVVINANGLSKTA